MAGSMIGTSFALFAREVAIAVLIGVPKVIGEARG
jgi:hypothetical protein